MTPWSEFGAEPITDQCPSCGLTSAAAEVMLRRRLLRRTAVFLVGSLAFPYISQIYPPLDLDVMLVFYGAIFFLALALAVLIDHRARRHQEIEVLKRFYFGFVPLPWIFAAALFVNGKIRSGPDEYYPTTVVSKFNMKGIVRGSQRLLVHSWRDGQRSEEHTSELQSHHDLVCRLLLEKKNSSPSPCPSSSSRSGTGSQSGCSVRRWP